MFCFSYFFIPFKSHLKKVARFVWHGIWHDTLQSLYLSAYREGSIPVISFFYLTSFNPFIYGQSLYLWETQVFLYLLIFVKVSHKIRYFYRKIWHEMTRIWHEFAKPQDYFRSSCLSVQWIFFDNRQDCFCIFSWAFLLFSTHHAP